MSDDIDWRLVGRGVGIPYGWRIVAKRHGDRWKLAAEGKEPMRCGHASMTVTADTLPEAVALMAGRVRFHRTEKPYV